MAGEGRREWRDHWPLIVATLVGYTCTGQHVYSTGVVMKPLTDTFGWSRADVSLTVTFSGVATVLLATFAGALIGRYGARKVAFWSVPLSGLSFMAVGLTGPSILSFWAAFVVYSVVQVAIGPVLWASAISRTFKVSRGLALGFGMSGTGIASLVYPSAALWLLQTDYGWRAVYFGLGLFTTLTLALNYFLFRPSDMVETADEATPARAAWGLTLRQAIRTTLYWRIIVVMTIAAMVISTINIHLVPLLTDKGVKPQDAVAVVAVVGFSTLAGRWVGGYLLDRIHARWIAITFFVLPAVGVFLLLRFEGGVGQAALAAALIGVSYGVEGDMLPYLIARYFGPRHYPTLFGLTMSSFGLGYALAPLAAGALFDVAASYSIFLIVLASLLTLAGVVATTLGAYPAESDAEVRGGPAS